MTTRTLIVWTIATALSGAACTVSQTEVPALTGPSGLATSLTLTANPDTVVLNGQQSIIIVQARDAAGAPLANLRMHLDVLVDGLPTSCGRLSSTDPTTGSDGRVAVVFTAPTFPLPLPECDGLDGSLTIRAFPVGTDAQATNVFITGINLLTPSSISQSAVFAVNFTMSPNPGTVGNLVTFSNAGSVSPGHTITTFRWSFSDGHVEFGPTITHDFGAAGTYTVTLTITDDIGQSGSKSALLTVN
jgi:PKD domain-containing protein